MVDIWINIPFSIIVRHLWNHYGNPLIDFSLTKFWRQKLFKKIRLARNGKEQQVLSMLIMIINIIDHQ